MSTLRDGEQGPGASLSQSEKLELATQIARLGVDIIEAGFPIFLARRLRCRRRHRPPRRAPGTDPGGAGLRAILADIDACWRRCRPHANPDPLFIATSPIQMAYQMRKEPADVLKQAVAAVRHAREYRRDVEFSAMDATRSDLGFLKEVVAAVVDAGACTINIPDTAGYALPSEHDLVAAIAAALPPEVVISAHTHDDLGLATASALAAIEAGATQVECTVNGIGKRAGNAR